MKRFSVVLAVVVGLGALACTERPSPVEPDRALDPAAGAGAERVVVLFHSDVADVPEAARGLGRAHGFAPDAVWSKVKGFAARVPAGRVEALRRDPRVLLVEPDRVLSLPRPVVGPAAPCSKNPSHPACGGGGGGGGEVTPWGVTRVGGPRSGAGKTAWVIDTGVDFQHADLFVDPNCSASFVTSGRKTGGSTSPDDAHGHGTHVAGTIAAKDNDQDVVGVAAGARICSVRVLDGSGSGWTSWVVSGVDFVAQRAAVGDVANMSLGGGASSTLDNAVLAAAGEGVKFALAAGNESTHAGTRSPARVNHANVWTVSAIGSNGCLASFSNYGNPPVDRAAPGVGVLSTRDGGGTTTFSGTSMAAPHVAGILLLGSVGSLGTACNDPDGNPDPIAHF